MNRDETRAPDHPRAPLVVAVDGTSGSGKSSTCRGVAQRLGLRYLDTGAQFRAMTWWMLQEEVPVDDAAAVAARAEEPVIVSGTDPHEPSITVDGTDVAVEIRSEPVTAAVSPVSTVAAVRRRLLRLQREIIAEAPQGIVVEGRDIASVVYPEAQVKVFLTADPEARAARRAAEEGGSDVVSTQEVLLERDRIDSGRQTAPLVRADGAVQIDTTASTLEQVVDRVVDLVAQARHVAT